MKTLFASCAVVALMAAPALAQSTTDPATPDTVPVTPQVEQPEDEMDVVEPQTDILPEEVPAEPDMAEDMAPPSPFIEPEVQAETETETDVESDMSAEAEPAVTAEMEPADTELEATVEEAGLPDEYSTDDLNARMLAQVNTLGSEISRLDAEADVWVSANGSTSADPAYAPEGQGDLEVTAEEEASATEDADTYMTPQAEMPESEPYVEPEAGSVMEDGTAEEAEETDY